MQAKRSVVVAAGVSAALLGTSGAFAVANGIFGPRRADGIGTFRPIEQRLVPATTPVVVPATNGAPPRRDDSGTSTSTSGPGLGTDATGQSPLAYANPPTEVPATGAEAPHVESVSGATPTTHSTASSVAHSTTDDLHEVDDSHSSTTLGNGSTKDD